MLTLGLYPAGLASRRRIWRGGGYNPEGFNLGFLVLCSHQVSSSHRKTNLPRVGTKKNVYTIAPSLTRGLKYECYIQVIFQGSMQNSYS